MKIWQMGLGAVVLAVGMAPSLAQADQEMLFQHKNWMVAVNSFDDGSVACQAAVDEGSESFTIWVFQDQSVRLQFYSTDWNFTEGDTADLQVEVDRRGEWSLSNATLTGNSALFDLPDSDKACEFPCRSRRRPHRPSARRERRRRARLPAGRLQGVDVGSDRMCRCVELSAVLARRCKAFRGSAL